MKKNENPKKIKKETIKTIIILLLFLSLLGCISSDTYQENIELSDKVTSMSTELQKLQEQVNNLQNANQTLSDANKKLEEEKQNLENEKNELNQKLEELQKTSSTKTNSSSSNSTASQSSNSSKSTKSTTSSSDNQSETVWVGNTGNKYHKQSCRTLKGKGYAITLQQALSEGREACKVCH